MSNFWGVFHVEICREVQEAISPRLSGGSLTLTEAAKVLGLKKSRLQSLINSISPQAFKLRLTIVWMIPKTWLKQFLDRIQQAPVLDEAFVTGEWLILDWLFRYKLPSNQTSFQIHQFIQKRPQR